MQNSITFIYFDQELCRFKSLLTKIILKKWNVILTYMIVTWLWLSLVSLLCRIFANLPSFFPLHVLVTIYGKWAILRCRRYQDHQYFFKFAVVSERLVFQSLRSFCLEIILHMFIYESGTFELSNLFWGPIIFFVNILLMFFIITTLFPLNSHYFKVEEQPWQLKRLKKPLFLQVSVLVL